MTTDMPAIIYEISHALNRLRRSPGFTVLAVVKRVDAVFITPSVFDIVQADAHIGRTLMPEDAAPGAPPVVVIGYDVWLNRYNGDPTIVGETVRVDGVETSVVGVMPAGFEFPISQDAWLPMQMDLTKLTLGSGRTVEVVGLLRPGVTALEVMGRLRPGVTLEQARAEFANIAAALAAQYPEKPEHHHVHQKTMVRRARQRQQRAGGNCRQAIRSGGIPRRGARQSDGSVAV